MSDTCKKVPIGLLILNAFFALLFAAPAFGQYEPPKQMTLSPTGVDLTTARFTYKAVDLSVGPFTLERSYIGGPAVEGSSHFGLNWTHNYATFVIEKNQTKFDGIYVVIGRGVVHFTFTSSGYSCNNPDCDGATLILSASGGHYVYTDAQGNLYTFNPSVKVLAPGDSRRSQRIARIDYADGHTLTYTYSGSQLKQIASNYGYSLVFEYGASGYVSKACGYNRAVTAVTTASTCAGAALAVNYSYAPQTWVNLTGVVDALGETWGYDYQGTSNMSKMTCVRQVNSSACLMTGNPAPTGAAYQQTTPDGAVWSFNRSDKDPEDIQLPGEPPAMTFGSYTGPEGIEVTAQFGAGLLDYYTQNGRTTHLQWDGVDLVGLSHPEGNSVGYTYRAGQTTSTSWSAKPGSGLATIGSSMGFADNACLSTPTKVCNKPIWKKDYKGNQTDFTYDPAHGGVLTETGPAVGGVRPQVRYEYAQKRAWVSSGGIYVPEPVYLYLPVRKSFCATGAASGAGCAIAGDEVVTTYDYGPDSGPNNLTLRSETMTAGGTSRRTCYNYDWMGNKISTTRPNGLCQ